MEGLADSSGRSNPTLGFDGFSPSVPSIAVPERTTPPPARAVLRQRRKGINRQIAPGFLDRVAVSKRPEQCHAGIGGMINVVGRDREIVGHLANGINVALANS
jgi:hypothetical protein